MKPTELADIVKPIIKGMVRSAKQNDQSGNSDNWHLRFDLNLSTGDKIHVSAWCAPNIEDGSCIILLNATDDLLKQKLDARTGYDRQTFKEIVAKQCDMALDVWFEFYTDKAGKPAKGKAADNFAITEKYISR
ncbi:MULTISPECIES: hypothetical protein [unclassified Mesorhizobium]|uniref:hypothetical protein n=1 Tax=unclassified Mesorhizobium TaxID=325217 RepID=UPI000FCBBD50|nr:MULTISPECIES: hypothetical protein [unclassified Mesorhizobium]RUW72453.1 hypothetical protein EOA31_15415 [Mesorhizobium sp. M4B.F.Ca.ET.049.02.1.2]RWC95634.1 MAG: hypothetical protein EOS32_11920 [Mesorhizobium sp.]TGV22343.1 hypothetical protein EN786_30625 [Mesorhizobium sp. M4B.F.Ca.ET.143.01.1.1]